MQRLIYSALILISIVWLAAQPMYTHALQSPLVTPAAPAGPIGSAPISPLVWIAAGFVIGSAIVFLVQRTAPHDR